MMPTERKERRWGAESKKVKIRLLWERAQVFFHYHYHSIMSVTTTISRAKGVAEDGRLHNVRTRHMHLTSLFKAIQKSHALLLDAVLASFPQTSSASVKLALSQVLKDVQYFAAGLDEIKVNMLHAAMNLVKSRSIHQLTVPLGTIGIAAYNIQYNPIAAIFGPLVSTIAAGCPCIIFAEDNTFFNRLNDIITSCLDKEAYSVIIGSDASFASAYPLFDKVISYQEETNVKSASNAFHVNAKKKNLVVVDQSIVDESVYRIKGKKPNEKELRSLREAAQVISQAIQVSKVSTILVSENIAPFLSKLLSSNSSSRSGSKPTDLIISCRSTEHIINELERQSVGDNGLFIFGDLHQASYLSRYTTHKCCAINCMPIELLTGYILTSSSIMQASLSSSSLAPIWPTSLFTLQTSTIIAPFSKIEDSFVDEESALHKQLSAPAPFKLRRKAKHLEFFPSGFIITAFPTLLTVLGLTGYTTFKVGLYAYRHLQPFVRNLIHSVD
jgi:hypothetical protein